MQSSSRRANACGPLPAKSGPRLKDRHPGANIAGARPDILSCAALPWASAASPAARIVYCPTGWQHRPMPIVKVTSPSGLRAEINANGSLRRLDCAAISLSLFVGNEVEGGPANLYLRSHSEKLEWTPLLGPLSPTRFHTDPTSGALVGTGTWLGIKYALTLTLAQSKPVWFWHVRLENTGSTTQQV